MPEIRSRGRLVAIVATLLLGVALLGWMLTRAPSPTTGTFESPDGAAERIPAPTTPIAPTEPGNQSPSDKANQPTRPPGATQLGNRPPVINHGPRSGNRVALTFDADMTEGMRANLRSGRVTSYANLRLIQLLERRQVPATFFLTGMWVEVYPQLTTRLAANPRFELANHTYSHLAFTPNCYGLPRLPAAQMTRDVARTFELIKPYGGRQTRYFRFPGLCHDLAALTALAPLGVTVVDGDVVGGDPFATAWQPIVNAVLSKVRPGSVIVLHVTEANAQMTDEALPHILDGLAERGLTPAPLSEVLAAN